MLSAISPYKAVYAQYSIPKNINSEYNYVYYIIHVIAKRSLQHNLTGIVCVCTLAVACFLNPGL